MDCSVHGIFGGNTYTLMCIMSDGASTVVLHNVVIRVLLLYTALGNMSSCARFMLYCFRRGLRFVNDHSSLVSMKFIR